MASIACRNGSRHTHGSVAESRQCWNVRPTNQAPIRFQPLTPMYPVPAPVSTPDSVFDTTPAAEVPEAKPERVTVTEGFWIVEDGDSKEIFKIQLSGRTDRLYGKKLEGEDFVYFASAPRYVSENGGRKLTADDARFYGHLYGRCMICHRTLENEESIAAGIGPICAGRL